MSSDPHTALHEKPAHTNSDTAAYLAAILPELAKIARQSDFDALGAQIEQAANLARQTLVRRAG